MCMCVCIWNLANVYQSDLRPGTNLLRHHLTDVTQFQTGVRLSRFLGEDRELTMQRYIIPTHTIGRTGEKAREREINYAGNYETERREYEQ